MNFEETISYLYNQLPMFQRTGASAYKEGLDNSIALDNYLGNPHRKYKTIHVGGTNGKGSTSHLLASVLQKAGYKTGLYTSPHLVDFRERIRVNGEMIEKEAVVDFVERIRPFSETLKPSFFKLTMMMAFDYFASCGVDIAIIEVGLGGRLDSTNIISPIVSVITNISYDHIQFLGDTLPKIAFEKAGIIKTHTPVIIGEADDDVKSVFIEKSIAENATIRFAQEVNPIETAQLVEKGGWNYYTKRFDQIYGELGGACQDKNAATVFATLETLIDLGFTISKDAVREGFATVCSSTGLQGRWQMLSDIPKVICDTAHNEAGIRYVVEQLKQQQYETLHLVIGMVNDKDVRKVLSMLPQQAIYYFTKASIPRALDAKELQEIASQFDLQGGVYSSVKEAVMQAKANATQNDLVFIGGSTFVVADALS